MHPLEHIRENVLEITQKEMADLAGTTQSTVSRWEAGTAEPDREQMERIGAAARERNLPWSNDWFFRVPDNAGASASS